MTKIKIFWKCGTFLMLLLLAAAMTNFAVSESSAAPKTMEITTADELRSFRDKVNGGETELNAVLKADIDLGGAEWEPIALDGGKPYIGSFYGNGHTIKNYKISKLYAGKIDNNIEGLFAGFFANVGGGGSVSGVILNGDIDIVHDKPNGKIVYLGGVAAYSSGAVLSCVNSGPIKMQYVPVGGDPMLGVTTQIYAGGIVGLINRDVQSEINSSRNTGILSLDVDCTKAQKRPSGIFIGGIVSEGSVSNSVNSGKISANVKMDTVYNILVGGICSTLNSSTYGSLVNEGDISAKADMGTLYLGGIAGHTLAGNIQNLTNKGNIEGVTALTNADDAVLHAGGIFGFTNLNISQAYNSGNISVKTLNSRAKTGGICGASQAKTSTHLMNLGAVSSPTGTIFTGGLFGACTYGHKISNGASALGAVEGDRLVGSSSTVTLPESVGVFAPAELAKAKVAFAFSPQPLFVKSGSSAVLTASMYSPQSVPQGVHFKDVSVSGEGVAFLSWNDSKYELSLKAKNKPGVAAVTLDGKFFPTDFTPGRDLRPVADGIEMRSVFTAATTDAAPTPAAGGSGGGCNAGFGMASLALLAGAALIYRRK